MGRDLSPPGPSRAGWRKPLTDKLSASCRESSSPGLCLNPSGSDIALPFPGAATRFLLSFFIYLNFRERKSEVIYRVVSIAYRKHGWET